MMKTSRRIQWVAWGCFTASLAAQQLDPLVVSVSREPLVRSRLPYTIEVFEADVLSALPARALDDKLKTSAAFRLFRRSSSAAAHPTSQGPSLRNLGPNGAGRTLVLVDGIPLNDPFGGWVAWGKYSPLDPARVEIVRGGGSATWGSAALGGTVQLVPAPSPTENEHALQFEAGDYGTLAGALRSTWVQRNHAWAFDASAIHSDGWHRKAPGSAGPIDRPTDLDQSRVALAWSHARPSGFHSGLSLHGFYDERGNGTPLQRNRTRSWQLAGRFGGPVTIADRDARWQASAYASTQDYRSLFTAVNDTRTSEVPVLDQYKVPADATGASATLTWDSDRHTTTLGTDLRWVEGETREQYLRVGNHFTRERRAGGSQASVGLFATHQRRLNTAWHLDTALRLEAWNLRNGHRREHSLITGQVLRDEHYTDRSDVELSPRLGLVWQIDDQWRATAAAYQAFRLPTLNELYRPFRVGNVVTAANPALDPEDLVGAEVGLVWQGERTTWRATVFVNEVRDAVANVTLGQGPGVIPGVGFVPAGGTGRQRQNVERITSEGLELGATWRLDDRIHLRADYLYSDARDETTGRWLPQVSRHTVTLGGDWIPHKRWRVSGLLRHVSNAYEDDQNTLVLTAATTLDLRVAYTWAEGRTWFVAVENVTDEAVVTGRSADGLIDLGTPRLARTGITWRW